MVMKPTLMLFTCLLFFSCKPNTPSFEQLFKQGNQCFQNKNYPAAIEYYQQALQTNNSVNVLHFNCGLALKKLCQWQQATKQFQLFLKKQPNNIDARYQLAHTLKENQQHQAAIKQYKNILLINPNHRLAHFGLGLCYLALKDFKNGLPEFWLGSATKDQFPRFFWKNTDLTGTTILIRAHWGLGDMIQFIRYAQLLKQQGATVIMQAYPALVELLLGCPFLDTIIPTGAAFPAHDLQIPLMDLMLALETTIDEIPTDPYLFAAPDLVELWAQHLENLEANLPRKPLRIGVCWSGRGDETIPLNLRKNIPLSLLAPIAQIPNIKLYSLQKINDTQQIEYAPFTIHHFGPEFDQKHGRFMDTAAVMKNLDLVLTVDTSIAHLAGALGVPVWIMLPWTADWRWFTKQTDSPWYPTARLFRQKKAGCWESVIEQIKVTVSSLFSKKETP